LPTILRLGWFLLFFISVNVSYIPSVSGNFVTLYLGVVSTYDENEVSLQMIYSQGLGI
jgi:hypothetical protein